MTPRPKNPPPNRRQDILDAALRVFARRGYTAATNAEIAGEAGVTAAALYYYFRNKQELFRAALSERQETIGPLLAQMDTDVHDLPPAEVIPILVRNLISFLTDERTEAVMRILMSEGPRSPELIDMWQEQIVGRAIATLAGYLDHQAEIGQMRRIDPRAMLMIVVGPVVASVMTRDILKVRAMSGITNEALAESLTISLLHGIATTA